MKLSTGSTDIKNSMLFNNSDGSTTYNRFVCNTNTDGSLNNYIRGKLTIGASSDVNV